jgi:hypothetical protein
VIGRTPHGGQFEDAPPPFISSPIDDPITDARLADD